MGPPYGCRGPLPSVKPTEFSGARRTPGGHAVRCVVRGVPGRGALTAEIHPAMTAHIAPGPLTVMQHTVSGRGGKKAAVPPSRRIVLSMHVPLVRGDVAVAPE